MTRKDYLELAYALRRARPQILHLNIDHVTRRTWYNAVTEIAKVCEKKGKFDARLFFDNAGVPD